MSPQPSYRGIKFPPYKYQEYPKWVGNQVVNTEQEELAALEELTEAQGNADKPNAPKRK